MLNRPAVLETIYNLLYQFTDLNSPDSNETNIALVKAYMERLQLGFIGSEYEAEFMKTLSIGMTVTQFQAIFVGYFDWRSADLWNESDKVMNSVVDAVKGLKDCIDGM